jgi:hypothetical protein
VPGTVVTRDDKQWSIEDDDGRVVYVPINHGLDLRIGDRVEVMPTAQGSAGLRPYNWTIVRKLDRVEIDPRT